MFWNNDIQRPRNLVWLVVRASVYIIPRCKHNTDWALLFDMVYLLQNKYRFQGIGSLHNPILGFSVQWNHEPVNSADCFLCPFRACSHFDLIQKRQAVM